MTNRFYTRFDQDTWQNRDPAPPRTPFEVDRDRIIHSYAFRRMQAKTQVFKPGEYDFYRTRLTHTIEVSQIGRSICTSLNRNSFTDHDFWIDSDLVEAVCLAHDLGHPPFGHAGERTLNKLMDQFGGFEGNAQTLRLLTETIWRDSSAACRRGMNPTRALMDDVLKCKKVRSTVYPNSKFIYDEQQTYVDFVHSGLPDECRNHQSIECQIMDWADEIAYSVGDFVDAVYARFIDTQKLTKWRKEQAPDDLKKFVQDLIDALENDDLSKFAPHKIGDFIKECKLVDTQMPETCATNRYRYDLDIPVGRRAEQKCLARISKEMVFNSPAVQQLEYKAQGMVERLFEILAYNYPFGKPSEQKLLKRDVELTLDAASTKQEQMRRLCDYVSGMSDDYIVRTCRRLIDPEFGSIVDLV